MDLPSETSSDESSKMDLPSEISSDESSKAPEQKCKYICTYKGCTASFSKNSKLTYHLRRHTGERPFMCDEPNCDKTYLYSFHLRRHKETHHGNVSVERVVCTHEGCFMELANKYSLKKHIKIKHNPERQYPFNCEECQQGFHRKRQLLQHSYIHTGVFPYLCEICGNRFPTNRDRNRHQRTHTCYACSCSKTFERWTSLLVHKKICEIARPKCNICGKTFSILSDLTKHQDSHLTKNIEVYNCGYEGCTRSYLYKKNLIYHINKYHRKISLPQIACTYKGCQKTFTKMQNLKSHTARFHTREGNVKIRKPREPRKDKGVSRTSAAALLAGLPLPAQMHRAIIKGESIKPPLVTDNLTSNKLICNLQENDVCSETVTNVEQRTVTELKVKLKEALLKNLDESEVSHGDCKGIDSENNKNCVCTEC